VSVGMCVAPLEAFVQRSNIAHNGFGLGEVAEPDAQ